MIADVKMRDMWITRNGDGYYDLHPTEKVAVGYADRLNERQDGGLCDVARYTPATALTDAAPELVGALAEVTNKLERLRLKYYDGPITDDLPDPPCIVRAKAALAKARGEVVS